MTTHEPVSEEDLLREFGRFNFVHVNDTSENKRLSVEHCAAVFEKIIELIATRNKLKIATEALQDIKEIEEHLGGNSVLYADVTEALAKIRGEKC